MRWSIVLTLLLVLLALTAPAIAAEESSPVPEVPVKGMATMVDLGSDQCIPCKMMAPTIRRMQEAYKGKAAIVFIDVYKHPEQGKRFKVSLMPTQIFYDKDGKEFYRHEGFFSEHGIMTVLEKVGVKAPEGSNP
jgi:thioredoxin 1